MLTERMLRKAGERLGNPLEWSAVDKGILLCWMAVPLYLLYIAYALTALSLSSDAGLLDPGHLRLLVLFLVAITAIALALGALGRWYRRRRPESVGYQHAAVQFFAVSMTLLGYQVGALSLVSGIVLAGAPIVGFILFDRRAVLGGFAIALLILFGAALLSAFGHIPYAPLRVSEAVGGQASPFWVISMLLVFAIPHLVVLFSLSAYVIHRWHQREDEIKRMAIIDALTDVANRRWIMDELERELERSVRTGQPLSLMMLDIDHFKRFNDRFGHQAGDSVLQTVAAILQASLRNPDRVGRYGGEEFLLLLPDTDAARAADVAERCRQELAGTPLLAHRREPVYITASLGVSSTRGEHRVDELIHAADEALYRAKDAGRNQVRVVA
jgi:diguanylate cyclase (GGDEF)-like protein